MHALIVIAVYLVLIVAVCSLFRINKEDGE